MSAELRGFDADNHYYEALDAFTRHIEPEFAKRCMQWATIDGKTRLLVGGKISRFLANPTFHKLSAPGSLEDYFRGQERKAGASVVELFGELEPMSPGVPATATSRLGVMDEQRSRRRLLLPDPRCRHGADVEERPAGRGRSVPRLQPLDGRGLGLSLPGAHLRGALPVAQRRRSMPSASCSGRSSKRRPRHRHADRPGDAPRWAYRSPADPMFEPFWKPRSEESGITARLPLAATPPTARSCRCGARTRS